MALYFITGNKNKFKEAKSILPSIKRLDVDLPEIQSLEAKKVIENKLLFALKSYSGEFIVEDTSLYFESLNGLPGPLIKWFLISLGNEGLFRLVQRTGNLKARAMTIIGYAKSPKEVYYFTGTLEGEIISPQGNPRFGWDPIFLPQGYETSLAQLSLTEKNKISMRGQALIKLKHFLAKY